MATQPTPTAPLLRPFEWFFRLEASGSIVLMATTALALFWANSAGAESYHSLWATKFQISFGSYGLDKALILWINDGLMAIFFLLVGLEIKREILTGELKDPRNAALPIGAAIGGMVFPALVFFALNRGTDGAIGWGIPMATDIAFALGALALLGKGLPTSLRIFLAAAAIVDDLGAVLVIALFYTPKIVPGALLIALVALVLLALVGRLKIQKSLPYILLGLVLWVATLKSGVHATIAGVALAAAIPSKAPEGQQPLLLRMEHALVPWVTFLIMPLFALANAGVALGGANVMDSKIAIGIIAGLLIGKQLGVFGVPWVMVRLGWAKLPAGANWLHMHGAAWLAAIGFTMALFIAGLALPESQLNEAKLGILTASAIAGVVGLVILRIASRKVPAPPEPTA